MSDIMTECTEVAGKTVLRLRLAHAENGSHELHLEFTDGTAFSVTIEPKTVREARLIMQSEDGLRVLRTYDA